MKVNGSDVSEAEVDGVKPGTTVSINNETIRILSMKDAEDLLEAAQFIVEHFSAN